MKKCNNVLTEKVLNYQKTNQGLEEIINELALIIYNFPEKSKNFCEDDKGDFYLHFYPKLVKIIKEYRSNKPFEHCFYSNLSWAFKTFNRFKQKRFMREQFSVGQTCSTVDSIPDDHSFSVECVIDRQTEIHSCFNIDEQGRIKNPSKRRQFLLFALQKSRTMTIENMEYLSRLTGYSKVWINGILDLLNQNLQKRIEKKLKLKLRFANMLGLKHQLEKKRYQEYLPERKQLLADSISRLAMTTQKTHRILARLQDIPSHQWIADATGFAKGTVDSSIYYMKKYLSGVYLN